MRRVSFSEEVIVYVVPAAEDRRGTWRVDAWRFRRRIEEFELVFVLVARR